MGLQIALVFGCLAAVAGRTITVEKTLLSLTTDSEGEGGAINNILQTVIGYSDVTSGKQLGDCTCSNGKCVCCQQIYKFEGCIVATRGNSSLLLNITIDKKPYMSGSVYLPMTLCGGGSGMQVKNCCVEVTRLNVMNAYACASLAFEVDTKWYTGKSKCFTIPATGGISPAIQEHLDEGGQKDADESSKKEYILKFLPSSKNSKQFSLK